MEKALGCAEKNGDYSAVHRCGWVLPAPDVASAASWLRYRDCVAAVRSLAADWLTDVGPWLKARKRLNIGPQQCLLRCSQRSGLWGAVRDSTLHGVSPATDPLAQSPCARLRRRLLTSSQPPAATTTHWARKYVQPVLLVGTQRVGNLSVWCQIMSERLNELQMQVSASRHYGYE